MTTFVIPGKPVAKGRPRFNRATGAAYNTAQTISFERQVGSIAAQHFPQPLPGPVRVTIWAEFNMPKSWSRVKADSLEGRPHTQRPDVDNISKAICDGLNRIAFVDDAQIYDLSISKFWGYEDQTIVIVEPFNV